MDCASAWQMNREQGELDEFRKLVHQQTRIALLYIASACTTINFSPARGIDPPLSKVLSLGIATVIVLVRKRRFAP